MCCRTGVTPLDRTIARTILVIGQFKPKNEEPIESAMHWQRDIPEEGTAVHVDLSDVAFNISISPAISSYQQHYGKRITAGVYFEIAAKYAEKVDGVITQRATVLGCNNTAAPQALSLASYPDTPMQWDQICNGFREVVMGDGTEV